MERESEKPLLEALMLLQGVVLSCIDRKQFPCSKAQLSLFTALSMEGDLTMKQAARYLGCSQEQATRAVAPLADAGLVERRTDPANRTRVHIRLTEHGGQYLREAERRLGESLADRVDRALSPAESAAMYDAAAALAALLKKLRAAEN